MKLFFLAGLAALQVSAVGAAALTFSTTDPAVHASIYVNDTTGELHVESSGCVKKDNWCGRYQRNDCAASSANIGPVFRLNGDNGTSGVIQLRMDGVLEFVTQAGSCVNPTAGVISTTDFDDETALRPRLNLRESNAPGASSHAIRLEASGDIGFFARQGSTPGVVGADPECTCTGGVAQTAGCNAHLDHHCESCTGGRSIDGKLCTCAATKYVAANGDCEACATGYVCDGTSTRTCAAGYNDDGNTGTCTENTCPPAPQYHKMKTGAGPGTVCGTNCDGIGGLCHDCGDAHYNNAGTCEACATGYVCDGTSTRVPQGPPCDASPCNNGGICRDSRSSVLGPEMTTDLRNCFDSTFGTSQGFPGTTDAANDYCVQSYWASTNDNVKYFLEVSGWSKGSDGFSRNTDGDGTVLVAALTAGRQYNWKVYQKCNAQGIGGGSTLTVNGASEVTSACDSSFMHLLAPSATGSATADANGTILFAFDRNGANEMTLSKFTLQEADVGPGMHLCFCKNRYFGPTCDSCCANKDVPDTYTQYVTGFEGED